MKDYFVDIKIKYPEVINGEIETIVINEVDICLDYNECGCGHDEHCMYCLQPKYKHDLVLEVIKKLNLLEKE
jgi:hypothetical protein